MFDTLCKLSVGVLISEPCRKETLVMAVLRGPTMMAQYGKNSEPIPLLVVKYQEDTRVQVLVDFWLLLLIPYTAINGSNT